MLKTRILTGVIVALSMLAAIFALPAHGTVLVFALICTLGAWEWSAFGALRAVAARLGYVLAVALLMAFAWTASADAGVLRALLAAATLWWLGALGWLAFAPQRQRAPATLACGILVIVPAFVALARLRVSDGPGPGAGGAQLVLWLLLLVAAADVGAYFTGRAFGRHRLAPRVSPGKTWEGVAGGLAAVAVIAIPGARALSLPVPEGVLFACLAGIFSIVGDLTESMFKRAAGLKDSGGILPGHGGVLDRIDGIAAAAPLYALGLFAHGLQP